MKCETFLLPHILDSWRSWKYPAKHFCTSKQMFIPLILVDPGVRGEFNRTSEYYPQNGSPLVFLHLGSFQKGTVSKHLYPSQSLMSPKAELDISSVPHNQLWNDEFHQVHSYECVSEGRCSSCDLSYPQIPNLRICNNKNSKWVHFFSNQTWQSNFM